MKKTTCLLLTACLAAAGLFTSACQPTEDGDAELKLAYPNWADGIALSWLVATVLEDEYGREVQMTLADPGLIYTSLAEGDQDFMVNAWLPHTHANYMERYGEDLVDLGASYEGAKIGLVVPAYVEADSITDLPAMRDTFDSEIIGIDGGAGIMKSTEKALEAYSLDGYDLVTSSGPAMTTALGEAIDDQEAIVITGWQPHWKFARYDLKFLDDPQQVYGAAESIHTLSRLGFPEDEPEVAQFLRTFKLSGEQLGSLMNAIRESEDDDVQATVRQWIIEHRDLVDSWVQ